VKSGQFRVHAEMEEEHWWFLGRRTILKDVVNQVLPPSKGSAVVDIGCGTGGNIAALASAYDCTGIDPSVEAIQCARERFPGVRFLCGTIPGDFKDLLGEAHLLLLMDVLEHLSDDQQFFSRIITSISPGAHLLITVPATKSLWSEHDVSFGHYRRYEREHLAMLWSDQPVKVRLLSHFNARLYPIIRFVRAFNRFSGRTSGVEGTDFRIPGRRVNEALRWILAGEAETLTEVLEGKRRKGYNRGASLVAVLRRE